LDEPSSHQQSEFLLGFLHIPSSLKNTAFLHRKKNPKPKTPKTQPNTLALKAVPGAFMEEMQKKEVK